ncbi:hypothetical protein BC829DRAFT_417723 [Chytridium lagenaria]|nr:hypothetical protein BC829DRAFT_417723 [Chytridium lagenaria]
MGSRIKEAQKRTAGLRYDGSSPRETWKFLAQLEQLLTPFVAPPTTPAVTTALAPFPSWDDAWNSVKTPQWFTGQAADLATKVHMFLTWDAFVAQVSKSCRFYTKTDWKEAIKRSVDWPLTTADAADSDIFIQGCQDSQWRALAKSTFFPYRNSSGVTIQLPWDSPDITTEDIITQLFKNIPSRPGTSSIPSMTEADITRMVDARVQAAVNQIGRRRPDVKTHLFDYTIQTLLDADEDDLVPLPDDSAATYDRFETHAFQIYTAETSATPDYKVAQAFHRHADRYRRGTYQPDPLINRQNSAFSGRPSTPPDTLPALVSPPFVVICVMALTCSANVPTLRKPNFF